MYLIDTDVISEARKGEKGNPGVRQFFRDADRDGTPLYLSAITIGELRQGVESVRHRGDEPQALLLERWLNRVSTSFEAAILGLDQEIAEIWGRLRVPNPENPFDKQIAATALINDLIVVTRNTDHYLPTGAKVLNPFT
jgi:toxin FitB